VIVRLVFAGSLLLLIAGLWCLPPPWWRGLGFRRADLPFVGVLVLAAAFLGALALAVLLA
jgi:hypothetical protein